MDIKYVDILTGKVCRQFSPHTSDIGKYVPPWLGEGLLASWEKHYIRILDNLLQYPNFFISIRIMLFSSVATLHFYLYVKNQQYEYEGKHKETMDGPTNKESYIADVQ